MFNIQNDRIFRRILYTFFVPTLCLCAALCLAYYIILHDQNQNQKTLALSLSEQLLTSIHKNHTLEERPSNSSLSNVAQAILGLEHIRSVNFFNLARQHSTQQGQPLSSETLQRIRSLLAKTSHRTEVKIGSTVHHIIPLFNEKSSVGWAILSTDNNKQSLFNVNILLSLCLIFFLALIYIFTFGIRLYHQISQPLYKIRNTLALSAKDNKTNEKLAQSNDIYEDLTHLSAALITLLHDAKHGKSEAIKQATADIKEHLESVEIQNIELDIARKNALKESHAKSEFLSNTSHEFRTPLNGILGFTSLLFKTPLTPQQREYLKTIEQSSQGLLTVISDVLDYSRLESGKLQLEYKPVNIREIVEEVSTIHATSAYEKQLRILSFVSHDIHPHLLGDPQRLKQVITNLVSNAIKFSSHGNIAIRAAIIKEQDNSLLVKISVADEGIGLSSEQHPELFKAFVQKNTGSSTSINGRGLGLAVAKGLVESMHGEIGVSSRENEGSEFWFTVQLGVNRDKSLTNQKKHIPNCNALILDANTLSRSAIIHQLQAWQIQCAELNDVSQLNELTKASCKQYTLAIVDAEIESHNYHEAKLMDAISYLTEKCGLPTIVIAPSFIQRTISPKLSNDLVNIVIRPTAHMVIYHAIQSVLHIPEPPIPPGRDEYGEDNFSESETHVLVVDDNPANLRLVSEFLKGLKVKCTTAQNGAQALEECNFATFDLILMDIQMPVLDGLETTKRIREAESNEKRTPIVALTAHAVDDHKQELLLVGMDDYLSKPISEAELKHIIRRWVINIDQQSQTSTYDSPNTTQKNEEAICESTAESLTTHATQNLNMTKTNGRSEALRNTACSAPLSDENSPTTEKYKKEKVFSIAESLELAKNKPDLAFDMLSMLLSSLSQTKVDLQKYFATREFEKLQDATHKLHGGCCYCGVPALRATSKALENACDDSNVQVIEDGLNKLLHEIERLESWSAEMDLESLFMDEQ